MPFGIDQPLVISKTDARRLAIASQHLAAPQQAANEEKLIAVLQSLRYLQLDPVSVVAPSHELVLWSRLGSGATPLLNNLLWHQRSLFEYWVYCAAIVLTEDYPMYRAHMNAYPPKSTAEWINANDKLRQHIFERLQEDGALPTSAFEDLSTVAWKSSGWTAGRNVERMLQFLWLGGEVMVSGRASGQRLWATTDAHLPQETDREALPMDLANAVAVEHAVRALGIARVGDVKQYFFRFQSRVPLRSILERLQREQKVIPVEIDGDSSKHTWFVHTDSLHALEAIRVGSWEGRTTLLSPFDNLISDRERTEHLWGFTFRNEMYVPKAQRKYGYYLMPILHGDRLIGRVSPKVDRRRRVLCIEGLYLEPDVLPTADLYHDITENLGDLAAFVGADAVEYSTLVPDPWLAKLPRP